MRYTKYFAQVNKEQGLQRISSHQLGRIMNIAFLEGKLRAVNDITKAVNDHQKLRPLELSKFKISKRLTELTGNRDPKALMQEICYLSERDN